MSGWHHDSAFMPKNCVVCDKDFSPRSGVHKFCSEECKGKWKYVTGRVTTEGQYATISGDWSRFMSRLRQRHTAISKGQLLGLLRKQDGMCALTGMELTCHLVLGQRTWTNASLDRLSAGGPYVIENVQLVCAAVNMWRGNLPLDQFIHWCHLVAQKHEDTYGRE